MNLHCETTGTNNTGVTALSAVSPLSQSRGLKQLFIGGSEGYTASMTSEAIKTVVQNRPFRVFSVRLANGLQIQVESPDHIAVHPDGKTFVIFEPSGGYRIVDIPLVTDLSVN